jgi:hypothetical protein
VADELTIEDLAGELRDMLAVSQRHPTMSARLFGQRLRVLYEFLPATGEPSAEPVPYLLTVSPEGSGVAPGGAPESEVDIVIRATPQTLHRVINGDLGGREAMASGLLDIRKAPSMPKLLVMRALFNGYKKARLRGDLPATSQPPVDAAG